MTTVTLLFAQEYSNKINLNTSLSARSAAHTALKRKDSFTKDGKELQLAHAINYASKLIDTVKINRLNRKSMDNHSQRTIIF